MIGFEEGRGVWTLKVICDEVRFMLVELTSVKEMAVLGIGIQIIGYMISVIAHLKSRTRGFRTVGLQLKIKLEGKVDGLMRIII